MTTGTMYDYTKHEFEPQPNSSVVCGMCEKSFADPLHYNVADSGGLLAPREDNTAANVPQ